MSQALPTGKSAGVAAYSGHNFRSTDAAVFFNAVRCVDRPLLSVPLIRASIFADEAVVPETPTLRYLPLKTRCEHYCLRIVSCSQFRMAGVETQSLLLYRSISL